MKKKYEYVVIGSGPGGSTVALGLAKEGKKVAIVDTLFGGTCALKGCTPKKAMESVTSTYWAARDFQGKGFPKMESHISWSELIAHKSKFTTLVPSGTVAKMKDGGVDPIKGLASFVDNNTLKIGEREITSDNIIIATGSKPVLLPFKGGEKAISSYEFFELNHLPQRVTIIGGGYIAFELSHIAAACGAKVTIISKDEMPFNDYDSELVKELIQATLHKGIDVRLGYEAIKIDDYMDGFKVHAKRVEDEKFDFEADLVINAAGRVPNTNGLELVNTDVKLNEDESIIVDDFLLAKGTDSIFAIGDAIGQKPFTEAANYEADLLLYNFRSDRRKRVDYSGMPTVVYTYPKMAMVGKCSHRLDEDGIDHDVTEAKLSKFFTQRALGNNFAKYRTCIDKKSSQILSAHLLGCGVEEIINLFGMAMQHGVTADDMKELLLAYPTATHDIKFLFGR